MPSDFGDRRAARSGGAGGGGGYPPPAGSESLPCPRCDSTNTKFCYYNNYNLSQPRHFCKACRRYWTQGGTLRNIPVGGGTRKSSKRFRPASSGGAAAASASSSVSSPAVMMDHSGAVNMVAGSSTIAVNLSDGVSGGGGFGSLVGSGGFLALGGYGVGGLGPGSGFDEMGPYGFGGGGRGIWAFPEVGHVPENGGGGGGGSSGAAGNGWPVNAVENGMVDGECFPWPELAISMPGQGLK